jgi:hypothetical protein
MIEAMESVKLIKKTMGRVDEMNETMGRVE